MKFHGLSAPLSSALAILHDLNVLHGFHPGQAKVAFIFICEPIRATDQVGCLGTVWKLSHVLTEGHSGENKAPS